MELNIYDYESSLFLIFFLMNAPTSVAETSMFIVLTFITCKTYNFIYDYLGFIITFQYILCEKKACVFLLNNFSTCYVSQPSHLQVSLSSMTKIVHQTNRGKTEHGEGWWDCVGYSYMQGINCACGPAWCSVTFSTNSSSMTLDPATYEKRNHFTPHLADQ